MLVCELFDIDAAYSRNDAAHMPFAPRAVMLIYHFISFVWYDVRIIYLRLGAPPFDCPQFRLVRICLCFRTVRSPSVAHPRVERGTQWGYEPTDFFMVILDSYVAAGPIGFF